LGAASYGSFYSKNPSSSPSQYHQQPTNAGFSSPYNNYYKDASEINSFSNNNNGGGIRFGEDPQELAYRNNKS